MTRLLSPVRPIIRWVKMTGLLSGTLSVTDVDNGEDSFSAAVMTTTYGVFTISADGSWVYDLNNDQVQNLAEGDSVTDTFDIRADL